MLSLWKASGRKSPRLLGDGSERVLGHIAGGGIFGEMSLIDNKLRMASARAIDITTVIVVTESAFEDKLNKADPFIRALQSIFVRNIRDTTHKWGNMLE